MKKVYFHTKTDIVTHGITICHTVRYDVQIYIYKSVQAAAIATNLSAHNILVENWCGHFIKNQGCLSTLLGAFDFRDSLRLCWVSLCPIYRRQNILRIIQVQQFAADNIYQGPLRWGNDVVRNDLQ